MLSSKLKEEIALKLVSLVLLSMDKLKIKGIFQQLCSKPIELPHYGTRFYSPKP